MSKHPAHVRVLAAALVCALLAGCSGGIGGLTGTGSTIRLDPKETPAAAAARLAGEVAKARTLEAARGPVRQALARAGYDVKSLDGAVYAQAAEPKHTMWLMPGQADQLALDQVQGMGRSLDEFSDLMAAYPDAPDIPLFKKQGAFKAFMRQVLPLWIAEARKRPEDPEAFVPLFLDALERASAPASDLTKLAPDDDPHLTTLEILLLTSGFVARGGTGSAAAPAATSRLPFGVSPAYADGNPCTIIKDEWGDGAQAFAAKGLSTLLKTVLTAMGSASSGDYGILGSASSVASVYSAANVVVSLIAMYGGYRVEITADPQKAHYLHGDGSEGPPKLTFTARVTAQPLFESKEVADCFGAWTKLKTPTEDKAKKAFVKWDAIKGIPKHARATEGGGQGFVKVRVDENGESKLVLDTTAEKSMTVAKYGKLKHGEIVVQANVFTEGDWSFGKIASTVLLTAAKPGNALSWSELAKAWADKWFPKTARCTLPIDYHELPNYTFHKTETAGPWTIVWDGKSRDGLYGVWDVTWTATMQQSGVTGKMALKEEATTIEGSDGLQMGDGTVGMDIAMGDLSGKSSGKMTVAGTAKIGGTAEAPTIELLWTQFDITMSGAGSAGGEAFTSENAFSGTESKVTGGGSVKSSGGGGSASISASFKGKARTFELQPVD